MEKTKLSIVFPVFNEEKNIPIVAERCREISDKYPVEWIFVEDTGSTDNTRSLIQKEAKKGGAIKAVLTNERGYGISIYKGLKSAKGEYIGWMHADMQTKPEVISEFIKKVESVKDKKIYLKGKRYGRPISDRFFTFGMSLFETLILKKAMYDINAQPNIFHKSFLRLMRNPPKDFAFDLYAYYLAKANGYKIRKFPVHFGKRIYGHSAWNFGLASRVKFIKRTIKFSLELKDKLRKK